MAMPTWLDTSHDPHQSPQMAVLATALRTAAEARGVDMEEVAAVLRVLHEWVVYGYVVAETAAQRSEDA